MLALLFAPLLALGVNAMITPTSPDSTTVVDVGGTITAMWTADTTGTWTDVEIQLMTGDNLNMVPLETVATGINGVTTTSYSFTAPNVSPYSEIYFLQFSNGGDMTNLTWTTRFTIAGPNGETTTPTNTTVYSGVSVNWGTGSIVSNSTSGSTTNSVTNAALAAASSTSAPVSSATGVTVYTSGMTTSVRSSASASASKASASASASASKASSAGRAAVVPLALLGVLGAGAALLL